MQNECYLYILMRTDMASMNPGKAVAQGAHAANMFHEIMARRRVAKNQHDKTYKDFAKWQGDRMFGTTITLGVTGDQLLEKVAAARTAGFTSDICRDPTYPLRDGAVTHLIPLDTCGYVFGPKEDLVTILGDLGLMA
jgi:peptidyl-tRNA hydrolase